MPQVRVIAEDGEQLGIMNTREAVQMARGKGLDLVEVAATADPPVCRIIDYGKFTYEQKKKASEAKKKQVIITVKEVKFRPGTDDHDYNFKMKHARQWLEDGDKVKATIFFRGREITHRELGHYLYEQQDWKGACRELRRYTELAADSEERDAVAAIVQKLKKGGHCK